jgi:hypothetical protein
MPRLRRLRSTVEQSIGAKSEEIDCRPLVSELYRASAAKMAQNGLAKLLPLPSGVASIADFLMLDPVIVTVPGHPIRGGRHERNQTVKDLWIEELWGRCAMCLVPYRKKVQLVHIANRRAFMRWTSNLDVHYTGSARQDHVPFRLGKLEVPVAKRQQRYLETWVHHMCPCILLCRRCHGTIHGKERTR